GVASRAACPNRGCQSRWSWWACVAQPQTTSSARAARAPAIRSSSGSSQAGSTSTARPASYTTVLVVLIVAEVNSSIPGAGSIRSAIASAFQAPAHVARTARSRTARAGKLGLVGKAGAEKSRAGRPDPETRPGPANPATPRTGGNAEKGAGSTGKGRVPRKVGPARRRPAGFQNPGTAG